MATHKTAVLSFFRIMKQFYRVFRAGPERAPHLVPVSQLAQWCHSGPTQAQLFPSVPALSVQLSHLDEAWSSTCKRPSHLLMIFNNKNWHWIHLFDEPLNQQEISLGWCYLVSSGHFSPSGQAAVTFGGELGLKRDCRPGFRVVIGQAFWSWII